LIAQYLAGAPGYAAAVTPYKGECLSTDDSFPGEAPVRSLLRLPSRDEGSQRCFVGASVSSGYRRASVAAVAVRGSGLAASATVTSHAVEQLPADIPQRYAQIAEKRDVPPGAPAALGIRVAEEIAPLVQRVLAAGGTMAQRTLVAAVHEPGLWDLDPDRRGHSSVCDVARLAELTGLSVVDDFASRDLAAGGLGGPLLAAPLWMLLAERAATTVLLDLGRTLRLVYLPTREVSGPGRILAFDVGPGMGLIDRLTLHLTEGEHAFDPGGRLAVQGRRIPGLVEHWLEDPYFKRVIPRWHPLGCRHEQELNQTVQMAVDSGWSVRDLLCTACHFLTRCVAQAFARLPSSPPVDRVLLAGGGRHNGMLLRGLAAQLPQMHFARLEETSFADDALEAAAAALLGVLAVDQAPANCPTATGASVPRVLGRITPGSPNKWQRLLREMADSRPATMPLRSAM
jgi:anhydro-N-acetylmuramic acid kinase